MTAAAPSGRLIAFEGGDGTGKSTQLRRISDHLRSRGTDPVVRPSQFADIQINAAMALAKKVGMPPRDAAARICRPRCEGWCAEAAGTVTR